MSAKGSTTWDHPKPQKEYQIATNISHWTIRSHIRLGQSETPDTQGVSSPIANAEEALVEICIQMGKIRQPLNVLEGVALMNDMIKGTPYEDVLRSFQEARRLGTEFFEYGRVTSGWWNGFKNRF